MKKIQQKYKFTVIATDIVIFTIKDNKLQVLLMKMKKDPYLNYWACPGRLVEPNNESVQDAAKHKLAETIGKKDGYMEQLYTFGKLGRDPFGRVVSVSYMSLLPPDNRVKTDLNSLSWMPINKLPEMAYDHKEIVKYAIKRLQGKLAYSNVVYSLLPDEFTMTEMQKAYEIILGKELDKRNFRKKINSLKLIKKTGKKDYGMPNRPAELYKFIDKAYKLTEIL